MVFIGGTAQDRLGVGDIDRCFAPALDRVNVSRAAIEIDRYRRPAASRARSYRFADPANGGKKPQTFP